MVNFIFIEWTLFGYRLLTLEMFKSSGLQAWSQGALSCLWMFPCFNTPDSNECVKLCRGLTN